jgi:uncharacterized protein
MQNEKKILKAAKQGNIKAQSDLGNLYRLEGDFEKSYYWLTNAANQGDSSSMFMLFMNYNLDYKESGNNASEYKDKASFWFKKASEAGYFKDKENHFSKAMDTISKGNLSKADLYLHGAIKGDSKAQTSLGVCYLYGDEIECNFGKAMMWLTKALENGDHVANYYLGEIYYRGYGVDKDSNKAFKFYLKAAKEEVVQAQYQLAVYYEETESDDEKATYWYEKAANNGDALSQAFLGMSYAYGKGTPLDIEKGISWLKKSIKQNRSSAGYAEHGLGIIYKDKKEDFVEAMYWLNKSAERGYMYAQSDLAEIYARGKDVERDFGLALELYHKAAAQGEVDAQSSLGYMYEWGHGVKVNYELAIEWYKKAIAQGDGDCMFLLGLLYLEGKGVTKSLEEAAKWINKARNNEGRSYQRDEAERIWSERNLSQYLK